MRCTCIYYAYKPCDWNAKWSIKRHVTNKSDLFNINFDFFLPALPSCSSREASLWLYSLCFLSSSLPLLSERNSLALSTTSNDIRAAQPRIYPFKGPHKCTSFVLLVRRRLLSAFRAGHTAYRQSYSLLQSCGHILQTLRAGVVLIPDHSPAKQNSTMLTHPYINSPYQY